MYMLNEQREIIESTAQISGNMFALPDGIIKHPEPLSNHHYILTSKDISPAAQITFDILQGKIAKRDTDKTFAAVLFEEHTTVSHIMLRAEIIALFAIHKSEQQYNKNRDFIYADELPHNDFYSDCPSGEHQYRADIYDPDNQKLLKYFSHSYPYSYAPQSNEILFKTCLKYGMKTCFNDASKVFSGKYLDANDPLAKEIAKKNHKINLLDKLVSTEEKHGLSIRNDVMAHRGVEAAKNNVIIQGSGFKHGGVKGSKVAPYENSLLRTYRDQGAEVTSVFLSISGVLTAENIIPDQALKDDLDMIIIDGMPEYRGFKSRPGIESEDIDYLRAHHSNSHLLTPEIE